MCYLHGSSDMSLFYLRGTKSTLIGYADARYLYDSHTAISQTGYVFTFCDTDISWCSTKQTMTATSSNHSKIISIHEASQECIWLISMIQHIHESCGLSSIRNNLTVIYEDNAACITQLRG
ncbi:hypothetical protein CFOL_v3_30917 [Cephalotus follicularis]|uniref:Uncharacterized protein n=1 Tax=Cephalotus follicularis TaxID=3775 RepID=A0A1Q3D502_CEPFO|nr:hypothetical protein CFOL_v3_30917 [Cephalotus follicularis]